MCLSVPGKITKIAKGQATIDYQGELRQAGTALLPDVKVGDYVMVSAKMIMQRVPKNDAKQTLKLWDDTDGHP